MPAIETRIVHLVQWLAFRAVFTSDSTERWTVDTDQVSTVNVDAEKSDDESPDSM
jgi:hypothetical protein